MKSSYRESENGKKTKQNKTKHNKQTNKNLISLTLNKLNQTRVLPVNSDN